MDMFKLNVDDMFDISEVRENLQDKKKILLNLDSYVVNNIDNLYDSFLEIKNEIENLRIDVKLIKIGYIGMGYYGILVKNKDCYYPLRYRGPNSYNIRQYRERYKNIIFQQITNKFHDLEPNILMSFN